MKIQVNPKLKLIHSYNGTFLSVNNLHQGINSTAEEIIRACDGTNSINDIVKIIGSGFILSIKDKENIIDFIGELVDKEVLRLCDSFEKRKVNEIGDSKLVIPSKFSIELTTKCQLKCKHCFNTSGETMIDDLSFKEILSICEQLVSIGVPDFFLTGGEATLLPGIEIITEYLAKNSRSVVLATNGVYLKKSLVKVLKNNRNIAVQISLDGLKSNHDFLRGNGSFNAAINTIENLSKLNIPIIIAYTLNNLNLNDLEPAIILAEKLKCVEFRIGVTLPLGRALESLNLIPNNYPETHEKIVNEMYKKYNSEKIKVGIEICEQSINEQEKSIQYHNKCGAGYMFTHLESNGNVIPCPSLPEFVIGNVKKQSIHEIFEAGNIKKTQNLITPTIDACGNCESYNKCKHCISSGIRNAKLMEGCELNEQYKSIKSEYYFNEGSTESI